MGSYPNITKIKQKQLITAMQDKAEELHYDMKQLTNEQAEQLLPVTYEMFATFIDLAADYRKYSERLVNDYGFDLFDYPSSETAVILTGAFERALFDDDNRLIEFYIHELDFGALWHSGIYLSDDGVDMPLNSTKSLWDALIENIKMILKL